METPTSNPQPEPIDLRALATARANDFTNYADDQELAAASYLEQNGHLPEAYAYGERLLEGVTFMRDTAALLDLLAAEVA